MNYEEVEKYLEGFSLDDPPYDPNGALHLFKSILGNMKENFIDADFEDFANIFDKKDEDFLRKLLKAIQLSRANNASESDY